MIREFTNRNVSTLQRITKLYRLQTRRTLFHPRVWTCKKWKTLQPVHRRYIFDHLPDPFGSVARKEFSEEHIVGYSAEQMYRIVIAVENYQEFVPWCSKSEVINCSSGLMQAKMHVGFPPVTESYISDVTFRFPSFIQVHSNDSRLFNHLETIWRFGPGLPDNAQTSTLYFKMSVEFRSHLHSHMSNIFMDEVVKKMQSAFVSRAEQLYGKPSVPSKPITS